VLSACLAYPALGHGTIDKDLYRDRVTYAPPGVVFRHHGEFGSDFGCRSHRWPRFTLRAGQMRPYLGQRHRPPRSLIQAKRPRLGTEPRIRSKRSSPVTRIRTMPNWHGHSWRSRRNSSLRWPCPTLRRNSALHPQFLLFNRRGLLQANSMALGA
jgi:hypothetical protein